MVAQSLSVFLDCRAPKKRVAVVQKMTGACFGSDRSTMDTMVRQEEKMISVATTDTASAVPFFCAACSTIASYSHLIFQRVDRALRSKSTMRKDGAYGIEVPSGERSTIEFVSQDTFPLNNEVYGKFEGLPSLIKCRCSWEAGIYGKIKQKQGTKRSIGSSVSAKKCRDRD